MRIVVSILALFVFGPSLCNAQPYKAGAGLRGGFTNGLTAKVFLKESLAIEGIASFHSRHAFLTALAEIQKPSELAPGLSWYFGGGGHLGYFRGGYYIWKKNEFYRTPAPTFGIDGVIGVEYVIKEIPFSLSLDIKPSVDFIYSASFWQGGLSIRYIFTK